MLKLAYEYHEKKRKRWEKIISWVALVIVIIFLFIITGCSGDPSVNVTDPTPPITENPVTDPTTGPVKIVLKSDTLRFYDGTNLWQWKTGTVTKAGQKLYSCDNLLYSLDDNGETLQTWNLITTPDIIRVNGTDKWIIKNIDPQTAYDAGGLYKYYTQVYFNATEYSHWSTRQYKTEKAIIINDELFLTDTMGNIYCINGSKINIKYVNTDFVIYDYNSSLRTAKINGVSVSWSTNYMNSATQWILADGIWYSQNGYTWNGSNLVENNTSMADWNNAPYETGYTEAPVLIAAGSRFENSETVIYFIECNSGWLIEYIPSLNTYNLKVRLYNGDGFRTTGLYYKDILKFIIIENDLYFIMSDVYKYNFVTGLTQHFASGVSEILNY